MGAALCRTCRQLLGASQPDNPGRCSHQRRRTAGWTSAARCQFCGCRLAPKVMPGFAGSAVLLTAGALLAQASPSLIQEFAQRTARSEAMATLVAPLSPPPDPRLAPGVLLHNGLFSRLREADQRWIPTSLTLSDGITRYEYRRRAGDPELSLAEIKALIANPPDHTAEREAIRTLLIDLQRVGVQLALTVPIKPGAAAEWDPSARTIRIHPESVDKGTVDFLRLLTHESIHVAQSCRAGQLRSSPTLLGLPTQMPDELARTVSQAIDTNISSWELQLEREAYANQHHSELGSRLIRRYCPPLKPAARPDLAGVWGGR